MRQYLRNGMFGCLLAALSTPAAFLDASAEVKLPPNISDRMVLQRDAPLKLTGEASPGEYVDVKFRGEVYECVTGDDGKWSVSLSPQTAGGPFLLEINGKVIRDVLVGDLWLFSGQSNQETPVARLTEKFPEINVSNNHLIRHYKVPTSKLQEGPSDNIKEGAQWHSATASDVMNWTALAYFFAQEAYDTFKVPQGIIVSSLGGSSIESWIDQEHLKEFPKFLVDRNALDSLPVVSADKGMGVWNLTEFDDSGWKTMKMPGSWRENSLEVQGTVWMRKDFEVPETMVGRNAVLRMGTLVDADDVYVNGKYVGSTGYEYPPRKYPIPAGVLREGKNVVAVRLTARHGNGAFIKDKEYAVKGNRGEVVSLTGDWKYEIGKDFVKEEKIHKRLENIDKAGSGLYNGMIYPLKDQTFKGVVWYQGETNAGDPAYERLLTELIANWRELFSNKDLPFMLVQLPGFMEKRSHPSDGGWARMREIQDRVSKNVDNTRLAVIYDAGEWNDIHPLDKKTVAHRVMLGARDLVNGEKVESQSPRYESMKIDGDKIIIKFSHVGKGLISKGGKLRHFAIAGEDRDFVWADAVIKGNTVVVSNKGVSKPVAVRYAWSDNPEEANLFSKDGLPAVPFRTDNW